MTDPSASPPNRIAEIRRGVADHIAGCECAKCILLAALDVAQEKVDMFYITDPDGIAALRADLATERARAAALQMERNGYGDALHRAMQERDAACAQWGMWEIQCHKAEQERDAAREAWIALRAVIKCADEHDHVNDACGWRGRARALLAQEKR